MRLFHGFSMVLVVLALLSETFVVQAQDEVLVEERDRRHLKLPGKVEDVVVGGSGRFLIAHLKSQRKLAIVDVKNERVAKYIPLPAGEILFTAPGRRSYLSFSRVRT